MAHDCAQAKNEEAKLHSLKLKRKYYSWPRLEPAEF